MYNVDLCLPSLLCRGYRLWFYPAFLRWHQSCTSSQGHNQWKLHPNLPSPTLASEHYLWLKWWKARGKKRPILISIPHTIWSGAQAVKVSRKDTSQRLRLYQTLWMESLHTTSTILMPFCFGSRARAQPMPKAASRAFPLCSEGTFKLMSEFHDILQTITVMKLADEIFFGSQRWPEDQGISESPRFLIHPGTSQSLGLCRSIPWHDCQETPRCAPLWWNSCNSRLEARSSTN